jgi:hypothetical protein
MKQDRTFDPPHDEHVRDYWTFVFNRQAAKQKELPRLQQTVVRTMSELQTAYQAKALMRRWN